MADSRSILALRRERNRLRELAVDLELEFAQLRPMAGALPAGTVDAVERKLALVRLELVELDAPLIEADQR